MKKFFYGFVVLITVFLISSYTVLFTNFGNAIIANIVQTKIKESTGLKLNITHFNLGFSKLDIQAKLADKINLNLEGKLKLFKLSFDLAYTLSSDENLKLSGSIKGKISDFILDGKGYLLGSNAFLDARIYDYRLMTFNLDAKDIRVEEILSLLSYPAYAKGFLHAQAKITAQNLKPYGDIVIKLDTNYINYEAIKKDFSLTLPPDFNPKAELIASVENDKIHALSKIYSDYFLLQSQKTFYDWEKNALETDFNLHIPSVAKLKKLNKIKLDTSLSMLGQASMVNKTLLSLNAQVLAFNTQAKLSIENNKLFLNADNINLKNLLESLGYEGLLNGKLNVKLANADLAFSNFDLDLKLDDAKLNTQKLKKIAQIEFLSTVFNLDLKANAKNNKLSYEGVLNSSLFNIKDLKGTYDLKNADLTTTLSAFIDDLSFFNKKQNKKNLKTKVYFDVKAHILGTKIQNLAANIHLAKGIIKINSKDEKIILNTNDLALSEFFTMMGMPAYAKGPVNISANIDLNDLKTKMNLKAKGLLNAMILSKILNKNFPNDVNYDLNAHLDFKDNIAQFDAVLSSSLLDLRSYKASFDRDKMLLKSDFILKVDDFSKLAFLLGTKLKGKAEFNGNLGFDKGFNFVINSSNLFEGKLQSRLKDNVLFTTLQGVDLSTLFRSLDFIDLYEGKADLKINYDISSQITQANLYMKEGRLKPNLFSDALKIFINKDITKDIYRSIHAKALLDKENIKLDLNMQADHFYVLIKSGLITLKSKDLNLPFDIKIDKVNFQGSIRGNTKNPKIRLNAQSVLDSIENIIKTRKNTIIK